MAVHFCQGRPLLKPFVDCLLVHWYDRLHCSAIQLIWYTCQPLHLHSCFSDVPVVCFNAFIRIQPRSQPMLKDLVSGKYLAGNQPLIQARCPFNMSAPISHLSADFVLYLCDANAGQRLVMQQSIPLMLRKAIVVCPCPRRIIPPVIKSSTDLI